MSYFISLFIKDEYTHISDRESDIQIIIEQLQKDKDDAVSKKVNMIKEQHRILTTKQEIDKLVSKKLIDIEMGRRADDEANDLLELEINKRISERRVELARYNNLLCNKCNSQVISACGQLICRGCSDIHIKVD
jgi:hypothetical protein